MSGRFCVSLTRATDDPDRATVAFVVANAALGCDQDTIVFLNIDGVRLAVQGVAEQVNEEGFAPLKELMDNFVEGGGKILVCSPCFNKRKLDAEKLVAGATIVGGAKLVEFLAQGAPAISY
ncbi:MAG: DsrE family protein [Pirellulaceae bacterium]|nr:DsrE family protein [Planctomycetales bacterium]